MKQDADYLILKFTVPALLGMLKKSSEFKIKRLTYIEATTAAKLLLKWLVKTTFSDIFIEKIKPRKRASGPSLNISSVRDDNDEVIIMQIYHHILEIRLDILKQLMEDFEGFEFLKDQEPVSMIHSYMGLKIATDINPAVYLAHYARWKYKADKEKSRNILVIPKTDWSHALVTHLGKQVDEVVVDKRGEKRLKNTSTLFKYLLKALIFRAILPLPREKKKKKDSAPGNIMVTYRMGVLEDKRNDIPFFHASDIAPQRMLIYFKDDFHLPSEEELVYMKEQGFKAAAKTGMKTRLNGVPTWKPTGILNEEKTLFCRLFLRTRKECRKKKRAHSQWLLRRYWEMSMEMAHWKDFFIGNNVHIIVNAIPGVDNFVPNAAIASIGGLAVELERSIRFDYCTYIHNSPNHVYFATGPYSLTQTPEPSFSLFTVQTGGINIIEKTKPLAGVEELKRNSEKIITVFDEVPNEMFFGNSVREMYQSLIDLVDTDPRFSLLLKTKKPQVLRYMKDIDQKISRLIGEGKCLAADWKVNVSTAVANGDLVVTVPSTAAFESVMMGAPTIVYNPMRSGSLSFYKNNGLNRRIFEDSRTMIDAIKRFADGKDNTIGQCSDILQELDPFDDGKGGKRMGDYLNWCRQSFDAGLEWKEVLGKANERCTQQWGTGRITGENAYEALYKKN
jgi:hypothetical protein